MLLRQIVAQSGIIGGLTSRLTDTHSQINFTHDLASLVGTGKCRKVRLLIPARRMEPALSLAAPPFWSDLWPRLRVRLWADP